MLGCYFFKAKERIAFVGLLSTALGYFLLISYPETKLLWYDAPLYPLLVLLLGLTFGQLGERLLTHWRLPFARTILAVVFVLLLVQPYRKTQELMQAEDELVYDLLAEGAYLRQLYQEHPALRTLTIYKKKPTLLITTNSGFIYAVIRLSQLTLFVCVKR